MPFDLDNSKLLIVDDDEKNRKLLNNILKEDNYILYFAEDGKQALNVIHDTHPDIILLDIMMPEMDGYQVIEKLKSNEGLSGIPIILLTALADKDSKLKGLSLGAEEFLTKPFDYKEVRLRVRNLLRIKKVTDWVTRNNYLLENIDMATLLPKKDALKKIVESLAKNNKSGIALFTLKIQEFDQLVGHLGEDYWKLFIKTVTDRLIFVGCLFEASIGYIDEGRFVIAIPREDEEYSVKFIDKVHDEFSKGIRVDNKNFDLHFYVGLSKYPKDTRSIDLLFSYSQAAMTNSTADHPVTEYSSALTENIEKEFRLKEGLANAIEQSEIIQYYQPIVDIVTNKIIGAEALMRWQHNNEFIPPSDFIPLVEKFNYLNKYHQWTVDTALESLQKWVLIESPFYLSINVSARIFLKKGFYENIIAAVETIKNPYARLAIEITEDCIVDDPAVAKELFSKLNNKDIKILIDDFGTGYSSFAYLKDLAAATLKIDKYFIDDIPASESSLAIVNSIINLATNLNMSIVAEGVESQAQFDALRALRCNAIQGYFLYRPMPESEFYKAYVNSCKKAQ